MFHPTALAAAVLIACAAPMAAQAVADDPAADPVQSEVATEAVSEAESAAEQAPLSVPTLQIIEAGTHTLAEYLWIARPLVVFADSPNDPRFIQQMANIAARPDDLRDRDVIVITDTNPAAESAIREALRPRGFDLVLLGKDGAKYLRKPFPWDVREISRSIDKMPLRQQELKDMRSQ